MVSRIKFNEIDKLSDKLNKLIATNSIQIDGLLVCLHITKDLE